MRDNDGMAVALPKPLKDCPVAQRMMERCNGTYRTDGTDGITLAAVAVVAAADRSITTATESVRSTGQVSVKRFAKDFDERTLAALILTHLTIVEDMLNVARPMKPDAMAALAKQVAQMLLDDDMSWNFADIQIVMDRLAKGEAGQVYGGLNAPMVTKAFTDYMCEKADAFVDYRERQAREQYGSDLGRDRTRADYEDAVRAGERVKHMAAMEAFQNGTLKKDMKGERLNDI
jgi:hypothetical protein